MRRMTILVAAWLSAGVIVLAADSAGSAASSTTIRQPFAQAAAEPVLMAWAQVVKTTQPPPPPPKVSSPPPQPAPRQAAPSSPPPRQSAPPSPPPHTSTPSNPPHSSAPSTPPPPRTTTPSNPPPPRASTPSTPPRTSVPPTHTPPPVGNNPGRATPSSPSVGNNRSNGPSNPPSVGNSTKGGAPSNPSVGNNTRGGAPSNPSVGNNRGSAPARGPETHVGRTNPPAGGRNNAPAVSHGTTPTGGHVERAGNGTTNYRAKDNQTTARIQGNRVAEVHRPNTVIRRPEGGVRTVVVQRPGNRVIVAHGPRSGYVQRPVVVGGRRFVQRTYYVNNVAYVRAYRPFVYHGLPLYFYSPGLYYPAAYYGWVMGPWGVPAAYPWGWFDDPWFAFYRPYFRPFGVYAGPSWWLTDYLIASHLQAAYMARMEEAGAANAPDEPLEGSAPMSDDIKAMIEEEVRRQIAEERAEAGGARTSDNVLPPSFNDRGTHLFLADETIEVQSMSSGESCTISAGDAIQMNGALPASANANVTVLASKSTSCGVGETVSVPLGDLVEMHNSMREKVDTGLEQLRMVQGTDNLPMAPPEALADPMPNAFTSALQPDANVEQMIQAEASQADALEQEILSDASVANEVISRVSPTAAPTAAAPAMNSREMTLIESIRIGQSESDVVSILGSPRTTSFLGGVKKMYEYSSGKVIFTDGDVSDVQVQAGPSGAAAAPAPEPTVVQTTSSIPGRPGSAPRGNISQGLTESQVVAILGQPLRVSFLGGLKKMYEYSDRKIIFTDGAVSEVQ
jgi:hypothetical protein